MNELKPVAWMWDYRGFAMVTANEAKAMEMQEDPDIEVTPLYAIPEQVKAQWPVMNKQQIKELALENGFKLKEQPDGSMDLNPYVYEFAAALKAKWQADILAEISLQVSASKPVATPIQIATAIMKESNNIRNSAKVAGDE